MSRRGIAIAAALVMIVIVTLLAWTFLNFSQFSVLGSYRQASALRAYYAAESGIRLYLALPEQDQTPTSAFRRELELDGAQITLLVEPALPSGVKVTSTGRSGGVERRILLFVTGGFVTDRREQP